MDNVGVYAHTLSTQKSLTVTEFCVGSMSA